MSEARQVFKWDEICVCFLGSSSYQGFPPRNDYRPDGYQGFNNNGFSPSNYQKRGGPGGINFPRGGANNRVATGTSLDESV